MATENFNCSKCGNAASRGFLADYSQHAYFLAKWVEGEPEPAKLLGLTGSNVNVRDRRVLDVRALRCEICGYLELYAV